LSSLTSRIKSHWIMVLLFLLIIAILPIIQLVKEIAHKEPIQEFDLLKKIPTVENLRVYETEIEDNSIVAMKIRPWYQLFLTRIAGKGNAEAIIGKNGWLFYRPSVDFIVNPASGFHRESGPLPAITAFHETLKAQGVDLIIFPVPGKASVYPEYLSNRYDMTQGLPVNPYTRHFFALLHEKGIWVVDPSQTLWAGKRNETTYLPQDTHWSPHGMKLAVRELAKSIKANSKLDGIGSKSYSTQPVQATESGDIFDMLNLPDEGAISPPLSIITEQIIDPGTGNPVAPGINSPIVLLGDSFANIYSKAEMGWGKHSGFGEHLAFELGMPVDVIAINDGGTNTSRETLARRNNALVGKKIVIWQFATRDLINPEAKWKIVDIPKPQIKIKMPEEKAEPAGLIITGEVMIASIVPDPNQVAYTECVTFIKYSVISVDQGTYPDQELLAVFWGMKDSKLMPAAKFQPGDEHRLSLEPFDEHRELSHIMQADDTEDYEHRPFWVIELLHP